MYFDQIRKTLKSAVEKLEDLVFPARANVREIEQMSEAAFVARTHRPIESPASFIFPLFDYKNPLVRIAVWQIKYRGNRRIAALIGKILASEIVAFCAEYGETLNFAAPTIVPIPISPARRRDRGRNQCELLAEAVLTHLDNKYFFYDKTSLAKIKNTLPQTKTKNRKKRLKNLYNSFTVNDPAKISGKNIILIDDVTTTGSTIEEAVKVLKKFGAGRIIAFTIAH